MTRKLRIAASIFFAILALSLAAFWIAGHYRADAWISFNSHTKYYSFNYSRGHLGLLSVLQRNHGQGNDVTFLGGDGPAGFKREFGCQWAVFDNGWTVSLPFWMPVLFCSVLAPLFWRQYTARFSLRSLLVAMTLVAVALGLGVWAAR